MKLLLTFLLLFFSLHADITDTKLKNMIARMLIVGFNGTKVDENSSIVKDLQTYQLGGVILFDKNFKYPDKPKNIVDPKQLKKLTSDLQKYAQKPLFIAIDQEGGKVARLRKDKDFYRAYTAKKTAKFKTKKAHRIYKKQSLMLKDNGINLNFAPVVDLAINPKNKVIVGLERSYGKDAKTVAKYASIMIEEQNKAGVISVLKHFPGHGSSLGDSHKGFVDVTKTWNKKELEPYKKLISQDNVDMIMTAHVVNKKLDALYPATLSYNINTNILRKQLGFKGVVVSDDMQMKAISKHYSLQDATTLAINGGVDILLFGSQLSDNATDEIIQTIFKQVKDGKIPLQRVIDANKKIELLHIKNKIIQKPIQFSNYRKELTKQYAKQHYNLDIQDITIQPKMVVLHWTAVMDLNDSFGRLYQENLLSDRKDIAHASALNVSAHFLVDRDGTIYQLMPENYMARHVIGLNYCAIGIENIGGEANTKEDLTPAQEQANIELIRYLQAKYPSIKYLIGHHEYEEFENTPLWLEQDKNYRTIKADPGEKFMKNVRQKITDLGLKSRYE